MTVKCRVKLVWPFSKVLLINKVQNFYILNYWTVAKLYIFKMQRKLILSDRDLEKLLLRIRRKSLGKKTKSVFSEVYAKPGSVSCCGSLEVSDSLCTLTVTLSKPCR